jgi:Domain of unknown function (DUF397)
MRLFAAWSKSADWRRSSYCAAGECAEIAKDGDVVLMRSTNAPRVVVKYTPEEFRALRQAFQSGEFDDIH